MNMFTGFHNASQSLWIISDNTVLLTCKYSSWCPALLLFGVTQASPRFHPVAILPLTPLHIPTDNNLNLQNRDEIKFWGDHHLQKNSWSPFWHLTEDLSPCMMNTKICGEEFGSTFETILVDIHTFSGTSCTRSPLGDFERSPLRDISWSFYVGVMNAKITVARQSPLRDISWSL